ncbi:noncanonical pyrimidine nucleotidase, YjjG family [Bacillus clarus]|uniref:HAD hydrolase, IA, variant 1 family protein n=1 Tax=Bacillus clarus TaxID=2338372 RepID=A0A090YYF3_9BACI|nr:YjjG family noncanonical pyrimidine nucleotidase [Bacillus clarus]KFN03412.1 HAD hydrolase, IA, variant 1 family protein [Bacillus clarus]RFT65083.1 noncanonical pyrimidine nucleotidase, YjjG family [Bacillus clarus]
MKYKVILFDVDDTLLDFSKSEKSALHNAFVQFGMPTGYDDYIVSYKEISNGLWGELERGSITLAELGVERFRKLFSAHHLEIDAHIFGGAYLEYLGKEAHVVPGVLELCNTITDCRLAIITNGFTEVQKSRIEGSPLRNTFEHIIISEEVGYQKPASEIFDYAFEKLQITDKSNVLMVGDSLTSDIKGGNIYGIDTCWYNSTGKENNTNVKPTYEIHDLLDIIQILEMNEEKEEVVSF